MHDRRVGHRVRVVVIVTFALLVLVSMVQWSWNLFVPAVFGAAAIAWNEALALVILTLLFSSLLRPSHGRHRRSRSERQSIA